MIMMSLLNSLLVAALTVYFLILTWRRLRRKIPDTDTLCIIEKEKSLTTSEEVEQGGVGSEEVMRLEFLLFTKQK